MARKTFKFRLCPNRQQREKLTGTLEVCRELYNAGLQERIEAWKRRTPVRVFDQINQLPDIKAVRPDVAGVFSDCGLTMGRDHAAALVILGRGLRLQAQTARHLATVA